MLCWLHNAQPSTPFVQIIHKFNAWPEAKPLRIRQRLFTTETILFISCLLWQLSKICICPMSHRKNWMLLKCCSLKCQTVTYSNKINSSTDKRSSIVSNKQNFYSYSRLSNQCVAVSWISKYRMREYVIVLKRLNPLSIGVLLTQDNRLSPSLVRNSCRFVSIEFRFDHYYHT